MKHIYSSMWLGADINVHLGEFQLDETLTINLNCAGSVQVDVNPKGRLNNSQNTLHEMDKAFFRLPTLTTLEVRREPIRSTQG